MNCARLWSAAAASGLCLTVAACTQPTSATPKNGDPSSAAPVEVGSPIYEYVKMPELPRPTAMAEPIVIPNAVVQFDTKVQIPAQVDGTIELIATPVNGTVNPSDPNIVYHPRDVERKQPYRRLRENDRVERGQTLVRLDEQLVARQIETAEATLKETDESVREAKIATTHFEDQLKLYEKIENATTKLEMLNTRATLARFRQNVVDGLKERAKTEGEMRQAQTQLTRYWCRSPVNGRIVKILKTAGEFAKAGDTILEIQSTDKVRVEGKVAVQDAARLKKGMPAIVEPTLPIGPAPFSNWHRQEVTSVAVSAHPGRTQVVSGGLDASALVWDAFGSKQSSRLPHPAGVGVRAVACTPAKSKTGHLVATGAEDGKVRLWDLANPDKPPTAPLAVMDDGHPAAVTAIAFSPDGAWLATAAGRDVYLWDVAARTKKYALPADHRDAVTSLRFTPQGTLVTVCRDHVIRTWKLGDKGAALADPVIDHRSGTVDVLGVSADGGRVLFDKDEARIDVVSLADGRSLGSIQNIGGTARFTGIALFSPTDKYILTAGGDADGKGELQLWELPPVGGRGAELRRLVTPERRAVTCAAFSPDPSNPFMVVGTQYGGVHYWLPPGEGVQAKQWIGQVESVLPADSRFSQVRVVMEAADLGDGLQDRSSATIIVHPDAVPPPAGIPAAPQPRPAGTALAPKPVVPAAAVREADPIVPAGGIVSTPVSGVPTSTAPLRTAPLATKPLPTSPLPSVPVPAID